jgi:hypothetical protein
MGRVKKKGPILSFRVILSFSGGSPTRPEFQNFVFLRKSHAKFFTVTGSTTGSNAVIAGLCATAW